MKTCRYLGEEYTVSISSYRGVYQWLLRVTGSALRLSTCTGTEPAGTFKIFTEPAPVRYRPYRGCSTDWD